MKKKEEREAKKKKKKEKREGRVVRTLSINGGFDDAFDAALALPIDRKQKRKRKTQSRMPTRMATRRSTIVRSTSGLDGGQQQGGSGGRKLERSMRGVRIEGHLVWSGFEFSVPEEEANE